MDNQYDYDEAYLQQTASEMYDDKDGEPEKEMDEMLEQETSNAFANVGQGLTGQYKQMMLQYWQEVINTIEREDYDFKSHQLPLARIKKVMKSDDCVKMISAEAPILFAKGCDIFITELTMRAWIHAEENKRRTLHKSDISAALQKSDMFDFLIDIVPRSETKQQHQQRRNLSSGIVNANLVAQGSSQFSQFYDPSSVAGSTNGNGLRAASFAQVPERQQQPPQPGVDQQQGPEQAQNGGGAASQARGEPFLPQSYYSEHGAQQTQQNGSQEQFEEMGHWA